MLVGSAPEDFFFGSKITLTENIHLILRGRECKYSQLPHSGEDDELYDRIVGRLFVNIMAVLLYRIPCIDGIHLQVTIAFRPSNMSRSPLSIARFVSFRHTYQSMCPHR